MRLVIAKPEEAICSTLGLGRRLDKGPGVGLNDTTIVAITSASGDS